MGKRVNDNYERGMRLLDLLAPGEGRPKLPADDVMAIAATAQALINAALVETLREMHMPELDIHKTSGGKFDPRFRISPVEGQ